MINQEEIEFDHQPVIQMPQIQRLQRLRIEQTQLNMEDKLLQNLNQFLNSDQFMKDKRQVQVVRRAYRQLFQSGKQLQVWQQFVSVIRRIIGERFEEIFKKMDQQSYNQRNIDGSTAGAPLTDLVQLWHDSCKLASKILESFQDVESQIQRYQRVQAQKRNDLLCVEREQKGLPEETSQQQPTSNSNRALQALQARSQMKGLDGPTLKMAGESETIFDIVQGTFYSQLTETPKGQKLLEICIENSLQLVQKYRENFLAQKPSENMHILRSFVKLVSQCTDHGLVQQNVKSIYVQHFEHRFVQKTQQFYEKQQHQLFKALKIEEYIDTIDLIFAKEDELLQNYFDNASFSLINSCIYEYMFMNCHQEMLKGPSGLRSLLDQQMFEHLTLLYSYLHDTGCINQLKDAYYQYIYDKGITFLGQILATRASVLEVMGKVLELKILTDRVIDECFYQNMKVRNAQIQSFQDFLNRQGQQACVAQTMSLYIHCCQQEENVDKQTQQIVKTQDNSNYKALVQIFRFIQAKDIFNKTYIQYLADRLIYDLSDTTRELEVISIFKQECGDSFGSQTEQMILDITSRKDLTKQYESVQKKLGVDQEFDFLILDSTKWPLKTPESMSKISFGPFAKDIFEEFTQMYEKNKRGKQTTGKDSASSKNEKKKNATKMKAIIITWDINYGDVEVLARLEKNKSCTLKLSSLQAMILLQFLNLQQKKSMNDLFKALNVSSKDIRPTVDQLVQVGIMVLQDGKYMINSSYQYQNGASIDLVPNREDDFTVIAPLQQKPTHANQSAQILQNKFMETLKFRIDARIIKNLKGLPNLQLTELVDKVLLDLQMQMQIQLNPDEIKERIAQVEKRINDLADREYIKVSGNVVQYVPV